MVDPYNQDQLAQLNTAAASGTCVGAAPFCTAANGILLSVDWCRFQGYPDTNAPFLSSSSGPQKDFSCHYFINSKDAQALRPHEDTHQCPGTLASPVTLADIFNYAIANGSQFIEITADLAADQTCYPAMAGALTSILSQTQTKCLY